MFLLLLLLLLLLQVWHRQGGRCRPRQTQVKRRRHNELHEVKCAERHPSLHGPRVPQKGACGAFTDVYALGEPHTAFACFKQASWQLPEAWPCRGGRQCRHARLQRRPLCKTIWCHRDQAVYVQHIGNASTVAGDITPLVLVWHKCGSRVMMLLFSMCCS
jgi:hypothetical protein